MNAAVKLGIVAALLLSAGCSAAGAGNPAAARDWITANALSVRMMRGYADAVELVLGQPGAEQYSAQLAAGVAEVERRLPTPDPELTRYLHGAAEDYGQGGVDAVNPGEGDLARGYLERGDESMQKAVTRSERLGRSLYAP